MSDFEKLINASDLFDWIMETYPDWCVGAIRGIVDHIKKMPSAEPEPPEDICGECDAWNKYKSEHKTGRWIPCSERLPENNTRVIVWMAWGGFSMLDYQYNNFYGLNSVNNIPSEAVAAWMPLPEPYREEATDETP